MHCYFVLAGNSEIPIIYHVERVRDGKSFATRTVQARQRGQPIFTTTMSFVRENSGGEEKVEHAADMPEVRGPMEEDETKLSQGEDGPFVSQRIDILNHDSAKPQDKKTRQWIKARGRISPSGGHQAHLSALAYMSDSYFIGTVSRVHRLWRYQAGKGAKPGIDQEVLKKVRAMDDETLRRMQGMDEDVIEFIRSMKDDDMQSMAKRRPEVGMMVSLVSGMAGGTSATGREADSASGSHDLLPRATGVQGRRVDVHGDGEPMGWRWQRTRNAEVRLRGNKGLAHDHG